MTKPKTRFAIIDTDEPYRVLGHVEAYSAAQAIAQMRFVLNKIRRPPRGNRPRKAMVADLLAQDQEAAQPAVSSRRLVALTAEEERTLLALPPAQLRERLMAREKEQRPTPGGRRKKEQEERQELRATLKDVAEAERRAKEMTAQLVLEARYPDEEEMIICACLRPAYCTATPSPPAPILDPLTPAKAYERALLQLEMEARRRGVCGTRRSRSFNPNNPNQLLLKGLNLGQPFLFYPARDTMPALYGKVRSQKN